MRAANDWVFIFCQSQSGVLSLIYRGLGSHLLNQRDIKNEFVGFIAAIKFFTEFCMISIKSIGLFDII